VQTGSGFREDRHSRALLAGMDVLSVTAAMIRKLARFVTGQPSLGASKRNPSHPSIAVRSIRGRERIYLAFDTNPPVITSAIPILVLFSRSSPLQHTRIADFGKPRGITPTFASPRPAL